MISCRRPSPPRACRLSFWKVAMRPGRPLMHGRARRDACARPARQSGLGLRLRVPVPGAASAQPCRTRPMPCRKPNGLLGTRFPANDERADYLRATLADAARRDPAAAPGLVHDAGTGQSRLPCNPGRLLIPRGAPANRAASLSFRCSEPSNSSPQIKWLRNTYRTYSVCS